MAVTDTQQPPVSRRKFLAGAAGVGVAAGLAGCGGGGSQNGAKTIHLWIPDNATNDVSSKAIDKFNKEHKDIQVKVTVQSVAEFDKNLLLALRSGKGPDLFDVSNSATKFVQRGALLPLNDLLSKDLLADYKPYLDYPENPYIIRTLATPKRLVYNKTLFEQAGLDPEKPPRYFSEVTETARRITEAGKGKAYGYGLPMAVQSFWGTYLDAPTVASRPDLTGEGLFNIKTGEYQTAEYAAITKLYRTLIDKGWAYPGASSLDLDPMRATFAKGKIGMFMGFSGIAVRVSGELNMKDDWGAGPIPVEDGATKVRNPLGVGRGFAISKHASDPEAAAKVLEYLVGPEVMKKIQNIGSAFSVLPEIANDKSLIPDVPGLQQFALTEDDKVVPPSPTPFVKVRGQSYQQVLEKLMLRGGAPESALTQVAKTYTDAYDQAVDRGEIEAKQFTD